MKRSNIIAFLLIVSMIFSIGCKQNSDTEQDVSAPTDALFRLVSAETSGVEFVNVISESFEHNIVTNPYFYNGGGVAILDFDHDGLEDVFFSATMAECKLYKNLGGLKFKDVTTEAGLQTKEGIKTGVSVADINGDGWEDLYICRTGLVAGAIRANLAFVNQKNGTFKEMGAALGLAVQAPSNHAAFFDADRDGDLDVYILNHPPDFASTNNVRAVQTANGSIVRDLDYPLPDHSDRFLRNENGVFKDVTSEVGIKDFAFGLSVLVTDLNQDDYPDLIVGNDYIEPDIVYINQKGRFLDQTDQYLAHTAQNTMGSDMADFNADGYPDFVTTDMVSDDYTRQKQLESGNRYDRYSSLVQYGFKHQVFRNALQINQGNNRFADLACYSNVSETDWSWSALGVDFDLDGMRDLFVSNGSRRDVTDLDYTKFTTDSIRKLGGLNPRNFPDINDYLNLIPAHKQRNFTFRNTGDLRFEDVSVAWGIVPKTFTNGTAYADLDNDGDMDLVMNNISDRAMIFQNTAAEQKKGNWVNVRCLGATTGNAFAVGAKIQAQVGDKLHYQEIMPGRGFFSTSTLLAQIGLGTASQIDVLEVEFPGEKLVQMRNVAANQVVLIKESDAKPGSLSDLKQKMAPLVATASIPAFSHAQAAGPDFLKQRLLPWRITDAGPCIERADVNGDGLEDVFVGGGAGQASAVYLQTGAGWSSKSVPAFEVNKTFAVADAVFFDADSDGDKDLVVAHQNADATTSLSQSMVILYLNDGKGGFAKAGADVPFLKSGSALAAIDLDGDQDLDLVVAEGHTLQNYPMKRGIDCFLNNGKGAFTDATSTLGTNMQRLGKVTDLKVAEVIGGGSPELIAVGEWMPITVFQLQGNTWMNATASAGLDQTDGFWNTLEVADLNGDGTQDIVAGNLGWNTRYRASKDAPLTLFGADFDKNGANDPVMCYQENGRAFPFAYRDVMVAQVPAVKKNFVRYAPYARADVTEMFPKEALAAAEKSACKILESCVFYNRGGKFEQKALPNLTQTFPMYGIAVVDVNSDGKLDLVCAGNDMGQQVETGVLDAGTGAVLLNRGESFDYQASMHSQFWATKEVRSVQAVRTKSGTQIWVGNQGGALQAFRLLK
jgi:enediyne biosynthesis protein E4